ncbi:calcium-responsive transactivator-like isoform X2 [Scyliorhinus canicula]|uniref:calcium-responsive transactivator-like isoform X2 n=1 Tax=Scyliorhinus canicula TaxID=7830 RepID=UPI0018F33019|nr:calcium-responsive transactivator-like isoform X2 [Scyliorhinus canicula]
MQMMLDENNHLIQCIMDYQSKGKTAECSQYQQMLHRNLVYLATIADSNQNMQSLLPAPPSQNLSMGPGGMNLSGSNQALHSQNVPNDTMGGGIPPSSLMQSQMSNGPSHVSVQQSGPATIPSSSMAMPVNNHGSAGGYSHSVPSSQGMQMQGQSQSMANYGSRTNMSMQTSQVPMMHQQAATSHYSTPQGGGQHYQGHSTMGMMGQSNQGNNIMGQRPMGPYRSSQQGSSQQYIGQEDYYGEQYGHGQGPTDSINQQYYPDGHSEYAYQQSSYAEQGYERSFEESSQHYYEGGNSQYTQQQTAYQQGPAQQQTYSQQQYPSQQSYPGQQQGYGPSQGAASQYPGYQQGQGQQYGSYRTAQPGPSAQQQRPYGYEQCNNPAEVLDVSVGLQINTASTMTSNQKRASGTALEVLHTGTVRKLPAIGNS